MCLCNVVHSVWQRCGSVMSKDGGVYNLSGDQDCSRVRVFLASRLASPSAGLELNFFKEVMS